jgi:hypothetical protein
MFTGMQEPNSYTATILAPSSSTTNTLPAITSPSSGDGEYSGFQDEESMTHEAEEEGWHFTEDDDQRSQLLVDDKTLACHLKCGILVNLFKSSKAVKMKRISLRLIDAHLHRIRAHPTQLSKPELQALLRGKGRQKHVKDVVDNKLLKCVPEGPNPTRIRTGRSIHCAYSALQYITRADFQINDSRYEFNTRIYRNLLQYVKKKFFNKPYLCRVLTAVHDVQFEVSASACAHANIHTNMQGMCFRYVHLLFIPCCLCFLCVFCMREHLFHKRTWTHTHMYIHTHIH